MKANEIQSISVTGCDLQWLSIYIYRELKQRRFWATDVNRKFMFSLLARFQARTMSYKALTLACTT